MKGSWAPARSMCRIRISQTGEQIAARIRAYSRLAPEQTLITSSSGFNCPRRPEALGETRAMIAAKTILSGGPGLIFRLFERSSG